MDGLKEDIFLKIFFNFSLQCWVGDPRFCQLPNLARIPPRPSWNGSRRATARLTRSPSVRRPRPWPRACWRWTPNAGWRWTTSSSPPGFMQLTWGRPTTTPCWWRRRPPPVPPVPPATTSCGTSSKRSTPSTPWPARAAWATWTRSPRGGASSLPTRRRPRTAWTSGPLRGLPAVSATPASRTTSIPCPRSSSSSRRTPNLVRRRASSTRAWGACPTTTWSTTSPPRPCPPSTGSRRATSPRRPSVLVIASHPRRISRLPDAVRRRLPAPSPSRRPPSTCRPSTCPPRPPPLPAPTTAPWRGPGSGVWTRFTTAATSHPSPSPSKSRRRRLRPRRRLQRRRRRRKKARPPNNPPTDSPLTPVICRFPRPCWPPPLPPISTAQPSSWRPWALLPTLAPSLPLQPAEALLPRPSVATKPWPLQLTDTGPTL